MSKDDRGSSKKQPLHKYGDAAVCSTVLSEYGIDTSRYNAISFLDNDICIMSSGKFVQFVNVVTGHVEWSLGPEDGGIGTVAVHPSRKYYVVGERKQKKPLLKIYEWPSKKLVSTLEDGAIIGFSACCFDQEGKRMATVGCDPDFTLAIWNWETKSLLLRNKCASTDVSTVRFSRFDNSLLVSGGAGHIKFWEVAKTFTGMKLQGLLGKFGRMEISNITGFEVLPDGKILSGCEGGCVLLWEGDLIKCVFVHAILDKDGSGDTFNSVYEPLHKGAVNVIELIYDGEIVVSAGDDGYMRYWSRAELDTAEGEGALPLFTPTLLLEVFVGECRIRSLTVDAQKNQWIVLDAAGGISAHPFPEKAAIEAGSLPTTTTPLSMVHFNGGGISSSFISRNEHTIVVGGEDGYVRKVDYVNGIELCQIVPYSEEVSSVVFVSHLKRMDVYVVGLACGVVSVLRCTSDGFASIGQWRPHTGGLFTACFDPAEEHLCTASLNGTIFFFDIDGSSSDLLKPVGFCRFPLEGILCMEWDVVGKGCLVGCNTGELIAVKLPHASEVDQSVSFEFPCVYSLVGIRQRVLPPPVDEDQLLSAEAEDVLEEKNDGPWSIASIRYLPDNTYAIAMRNAELVYKYHCSVRYPDTLALPPLPPTGVEPPDYVEEPGENLCFTDCTPDSLFLSSNAIELVVVCESNLVLLRSLTGKTSVSLAGAAHDSTIPHTVKGAHVSFDGSTIVTVGAEGVVVSQLREGCPRPQAVAAGSPAGLKKVAPKAVAAVLREALPEESGASPLLSIQEQKELDDQKKAEAQQQLLISQFLEKVKDIHENYAEVLELNSQLPPDLQLTREELQLDPVIENYLSQEKENRVKEARKEFMVEAAREDIKTHKLRKRFVDNLLCDRVLLHSFSNQFSVATFRAANPEEAILRLEEEIAHIEASDDEKDDGEENGAVGEHHGDESPVGANKTLDEAGAAVHEVHGDDALPGAGMKKVAPKNMSASVKQQLDKLDERRKERDERRRGYDAILARRPNPEIDDRELALQIQHDTENRGECVLRSDDEYKSAKPFVPTVKAKLKRLIFLEQYLVDMKAKFNAKFFSAREEKRERVVELNTMRARIGAINQLLNDDSFVSTSVTMTPEEEPEKLYELNRSDLDEYSRRKDEERLRQEQEKKAQRGFGADLAGAQTVTHQPPPTSALLDGTAKHQQSVTKLKVKRNSTQERSSRSSTIFHSMSRDRVNNELKQKLENVKLCEQEEEEREIQKLQLRTERQELDRRCAKLISEFDDKLMKLLQERASIDADLCLADAHLLLLFREYQLLLVYRSRDKGLRHEMRALRQSAVLLHKQLTDLQEQMVQKEKEVAELTEKKKENKNAGETYINENFPSDKVAYVLKIFNRKIKRKLSDEDDDNDDITSDDEDEDAVEDDVVEEICPASCSVECWNNVLRLRTNRLDIIDALAACKAALEGFAKKQATIQEHDLKDNTAEIQACEAKVKEMECKKRKELNMLNTVVPLKCHQVKSLTKDELLPRDLKSKDVVVINSEEMTRLVHHIEELAVTKQKRRDNLQESSALMQALQQRKAEVQKVHTTWEGKVHEVMMLKFGQHVDLEMLETCGTSRRIEAKKEQLRQLELGWEREIRKQENRISALRDKLQNKLIQNTHLLQDFGTYESERQKTEKALAESTAKASAKFKVTRIATSEDRENLRELITAQQEEIAALQSEIVMLKRKGGHAYSPSMF